MAGQGSGSYDPAVFLRKSAKGDHIYGFMPEGVKQDMSMVVSIEELRKLVKGEVDFVRASLLKPRGGGEKKNSQDTL